MPYNLCSYKRHCSTNQDDTHLDHTAVCDVTVKKREYVSSMQVMMWVCMYVHTCYCASSVLLWV